MIKKKSSKIYRRNLLSFLIKIDISLPLQEEKPLKIEVKNQVQTSKKGRKIKQQILASHPKELLP
jgi:hypothetical protein